MRQLFEIEVFNIWKTCSFAVLGLEISGWAFDCLEELLCPCSLGLPESKPSGVGRVEHKCCLCSTKNSAVVCAVAS